MNQIPFQKSSQLCSPNPIAMASLRPIPSSPLLLRTHGWAPLRRPPQQKVPSPAVMVSAMRSRPEAASAASSCAPPRPVAPAVEAHDAADGSPSKASLFLEEQIERVIYRCRFLTIFGVMGSLMGSVLCFLKGCVYVINSFGEYTVSGGKVIVMVVEAIDVYLIGTVMLVFGMGLYELFISNFDVAKTSSYGSNLLGLFKLSERPKWLEIQSVNELKTKLGHVIVMVLLVGLFDKSRKVTISSSIDLLCFAVSIFLSSSCLYLLSKLHTSKQGKDA